jgi:hypothetical protein
MQKLQGDIRTSMGGSRQRHSPSTGAARGPHAWRSRAVRTALDERPSSGVMTAAAYAAAIGQLPEIPAARGRSKPLQRAARAAAAAAASALLLLQATGGAGAATELAAVGACPVVGDMAGLFGGEDEGAPEPFTLYGTNFKL